MKKLSISDLTNESELDFKDAVITAYVLEIYNRSRSYSCHQNPNPKENKWFEKLVSSTRLSMTIVVSFGIPLTPGPQIPWQRPPAEMLTSSTCAKVERTSKTQSSFTGFGSLTSNLATRARTSGVPWQRVTPCRVSCLSLGHRRLLNGHLQSVQNALLLNKLSTLNPLTTDQARF